MSEYDSTDPREGPAEGAEGPVPHVLPDGPSAPPEAVDLETVILGASPRYTAAEVVEAADIPVAKASRLWRAMGFADVDTARALTDGDIQMLSRVAAFFRAEELDESFAIEIARAFGQTMARLADWQMTALLEYLENAEFTGEIRKVATHHIMEWWLPEFERMLIYSWRRHLAAVAVRLVDGAGDDETSTRLAVGFADLVGFTRLSRRLEKYQLTRLVETFESHSADLITSLGGRLVKTLGDEVMFVADSPEAAAEIGLRLVETLAGDKSIPELRVGMAVGTVVTHTGDVYGTTVNMASRLTSLAPRNTVVIDPKMAHALAGKDEYEVDTMRRRRVRGFGLVVPWMLTRRPGPPS